MAHRVQDARPEQLVPAGLRQGERLDEVPLRQRAARHAVITHPRRQQRRLGHRGKQRAADGPGIAAAEQAICVAAEVLDQGLARIPAAEPVVKLPERLYCHREPLDVSHAHAHVARQVGLRRADRINKPPQRGILPRARVDSRPRQHALVGEVGPPQRRNVPGGLPGRTRIVQADLGEGRRPGLRHADPGSRRRAGIKPQCLPRGGRQAQSIGERREDRDFLRPVLARLVVTQLDLMQAGQARHLRLSKAVLLKDPDDVAQIPLRACVEDVLACADPLHDPAHLRDRQNHGALPVPLVARQPVRCRM